MDTKRAEFEELLINLSSITSNYANEVYVEGITYQRAFKMVEDIKANVTPLITLLMEERQDI